MTASVEIDPPAETETPSSRRLHAWYATGPAIVGYVALSCFALHVWTAGRYGYFRDELYYIACSNHLDWGYVDQPPFIALITKITLALFGDSLRALRLLPAAAGAGLVLLAGQMAKELGGRRFAQALGALVVFIAPVYLATGYILTMNAFEALIWMGCAYVLILAIKRQNPRLLVWFGLLAGVGLQNKYSILVFGFGIFVGLLLTPARKLLVSKWMWLGLAITVGIFLPNLIWNIRRHFPFVELMRNIRASGRDIQLGLVDFIWQQVLLINPLTFPIWLAGLWFFFFSSKGKPYRALGWAYTAMLAAFVLLHGKNYYLAPAYPMLLAAGGVAIDDAISKRKRLVWAKPAIATVFVAAGVALAPIVVPLLPVDSYLKYQDVLPFGVPRSEQSHLAAALPQLYADQFGWEEMTAEVARIYNGLTAEERAKTAIYADNYGEAGAIDFFGKQYGLPKSISGHQNYYLWGPRDYTGEIMIVLGQRREQVTPEFDHIEVAAELNNSCAIPFEDGPIFLCRGLKWNLQECWPRVKHWK